MFLSIEIFFLPQAVDKKFGKRPFNTMATNMGLCQEHACAPFSAHHCLLPQGSM